jgi:hypothetical protein
VSQPGFEDVCRAYVRDAIGLDPDLPPRGEVGAWWGPVPDPRHPGTRRTMQGESEIVVLDGTRLLLVGESKWQSGPADLATVAQLDRTAPHIPGFDPAVTRLAIFSRGGFTDALREEAASRSIVLRSVDDLYARV